MNRTIRMLRQGVLGLAFAGAMGFGATQAFATARLAPPEYICVPGDWTRSDQRCSRECVSGGHDGGQCNSTYTACECYDNPPIWPEW